MGNEELTFTYYRSWRWFVEVIQSPSNLINRRLHLIIAWPYIRLLFLCDTQDSLFIQQIKQIDEEYMTIQNEFIRFYHWYQNQIHDFIQTKSEYEFLCRKYEVYRQIDLFEDNKSKKNLEKYLQYWFHYQTKLTKYFQQIKQSQVINIYKLKGYRSS